VWDRIGGRKIGCPLSTTMEVKADNPTKSQRKVPAAGAVVSSKVPFFPRQQRGLWKIGRKFYDLGTFLDKHPGGRRILELSRDRFGDSTYAFEAHHANQPRVRKMLERYRAAGEPDAADGPVLSDLAGFYGVLRARVDALLRTPAQRGPTAQCKALFFGTLAAFLALHVALLAGGPRLYGWLAVPLALASGVLGGFGHNFVHQPRYRRWAYASLDVIGFSSENWLREHVLQHHMYTNSELDNHFRGTDPHLSPHPTEPRSAFNKISTLVWPVVLCFAVFGNWLNVAASWAKNQETWRPTMFIQPALWAAHTYLWGTPGLVCCFLVSAVLGVWYFTVALMNHNTDHTVQVTESEPACWGTHQLQTCSDIGVGLGFLPSWRYLWLNYHTVHHLFPATDMSRHPAIQQVLIRTAKEFGVPYVCQDLAESLRQTITNFMYPIRGSPIRGGSEGGKGGNTGGKQLPKAKGGAEAGTNSALEWCVAVGLWAGKFVVASYVFPPAVAFFGWVGVAGVGISSIALHM